MAATQDSTPTPTPKGDVYKAITATAKVLNGTALVYGDNGVDHAAIRAAVQKAQAGLKEILRVTDAHEANPAERATRTGKRIAAMANLLMSMDSDLTEAEAIAKVREAEKATQAPKEEATA